jgi:tetratricopeptide (TPR) repeat protein
MNHSNKYSIIGFSLFILFCCAGCSKSFLEVEPKGKLIAKNTNDYNLLLNDPVLYIASPVTHVVMSDELAGIEPYFSIAGSGIATLADKKAFEWQADIYLPGETQSEMGILVRQLYDYNKIINEVMDSKNGTEAEKKTVRAEALAGRAYTFFSLINYYSKPYNAATAATDPGVPMIVTAEATRNSFTRGTVQEAYDRIIADLETAIPDLPSNLISRIRMCKAAGQALLGKVYMFMGKFDKAAPLLDDAMAGLSNASIEAGLFDYNTQFQPGGVFFPSNPFTGPAAPDPGNTDIQVLYLKRYLNLYKYFLSGIVLSPETVQLFGSTDMRKNFHGPGAFGSPSSYPLNMKRVYGPFYTNLGISIPDIYLLSAECRSRLNRLDEAVELLEQFRKKRMPASDAAVPAAIASDQLALTRFILEERIREFAMDGYRWFDMRRLSVDPDHKSTIRYAHKVYDAAGNIVATSTLSTERLTLRLPLNIMEANPNLPQNP